MSLTRIFGLNCQLISECLILTEIQLRYSEWMPYRMRAYAALAEEKYHLPVYPVLVNVLPPAATTVVQDRFQ